MYMERSMQDWLKAKDLEYRNNTLYYGDTPVKELAEKYGTPLYIINEDIIRARYRKLSETLKKYYSNVRIHYAVKANTNLAVLKILHEEGCYADCVSPGEVEACLRAGFKPEEILQTSNNWTDEELEFALEKGIMINLDAISHIKRLSAICKEKNIELPLLSFRVNPYFGAGHHSHTITAGPDIKFGIFEKQVLEAYQIALDHGFKRFGIHMHIGSGILEVEPWKKAINKFFEIVERVVKEKKIQFEFLDFGGGIGIPYKPDQQPLDLDAYAQTVIGTMKQKCEELNLGAPILAIEPGRYLSAEASIIATQVNTYKDTGFKIFIGTDAGFNVLIRPAFYGSYHEIIPVDLHEEREEIVADIVGQLCESGDVTGKMRTIRKVEEKEYLAILDAGAYGFSMASTYNSRPLPAEVLIKRGIEPVLVRERQTIEALFQRQHIPEHLR